MSDGCEGKKIIDRRVRKAVEKKVPFEIEVDGEKIPAFEGETIAAAILAAGIQVFRKTSKRKEGRGIYCGVGTCCECRMIVNGKPNVLACQTVASPNCKVQTQIGTENWSIGNG